MVDSAYDYAKRMLMSETDRRQLVKLRKTGNAYAVTIPKSWLRELGLGVGDYVVLDRIRGKIVMCRADVEAL